MKNVRFLAHGVLAGLAIVIGSLIAHAYDTTWIEPGQVISAQKLRGALDEAQTRISALEAQVAKVTEPTVCQITSEKYTGKIVYEGQTGYRAARLACSEACHSSTAHMCTASELVRIAGNGNGPTTGKGWYAMGITIITTQYHMDCSGYGNDDGGAGSVRGSLWHFDNITGYDYGYDDSACSVQQSILCCD